MPPRDPLHGWTLASLDAVAWTSVRMAGPKACDVRDRYEAAWHAITEVILTAGEPPSLRDLRYAGMAAANQVDRDERRHHGLNRGNEDAERFAWYWHQRVTHSAEDGIVDRLACEQIWDELRPVHQSVLLALAAHDSRESAAAACGKTYRTLNSHLKDARRAFLALWHEGEVPSRFWGSDDRRHGGQPVTLALRKKTAKRLRKAQAAA